jgi:N-acetylmuramic acid 6-phosphate etherase
MLTTTAMIRSGKCYENLMVDVHASNEKLVARASRIVMQATGCSHQQAKSVLEYANYSAKLAILMQLTQVSAQQGQSCLNQHNGRLNDAIKALRG